VGIIVKLITWKPAGLICQYLKGAPTKRK